MEYQTKSPGSVVDDAAVGTIAWSNPNNAKTSNNTFAEASFTGTDIKDYAVKIVKSDGSVGSENKASGINWAATRDTYYSYGGSEDLWGESWSSTDINNANFGVVLSAKDLSGSPVTHYLKVANFGFLIPEGATIDGILVEIERTYFAFLISLIPLVDHIRITVYYTPAVVEGFLDITKIILKDTEVFPTTNPVFMGEGEIAQFNIRVKNTGTADDFRVEIFGDGELLKYDEFSCPAGVEDWIYPDPGIVLTMGNQDIVITIKTFHLEATEWIQDDVQSFTIIFISEGFLDITGMTIYNLTTGMMYEYAPGGPFGDWVPYEPEAHEGDSMRVLIKVKNIGLDDDFKTELIGDVIGEDLFSLGAGLTHNSNFYFTMPNHDAIVTANAYHFEEPEPPWTYTGVSYDISPSVPWVNGPWDFFWDGTNWFVSDWDGNRIYKFNSSWVYTGVSYDVSAQGPFIHGIFWDGINWWAVGGYANRRVYKYDSNWVYTGVSYDVSQNADPAQIFWDGNNWWMLGWSEPQRVYKYDSNWNYLGISYDISPPEEPSIWLFNDIFWDGTNWWATRSDVIYKYDSNWNYLGISYDITAQGIGGPNGIFWDGTNWWAIKSNKRKVWKYTG